MQFVFSIANEIDGRFAFTFYGIFFSRTIKFYHFLDGKVFVVHMVKHGIGEAIHIIGREQRGNGNL